MMETPTPASLVTILAQPALVRFQPIAHLAPQISHYRAIYALVVASNIINLLQANVNLVIILVQQAVQVMDPPVVVLVPVQNLSILESVITTVLLINTLIILL